jgi:hypothetical protein
MAHAAIALPNESDSVVNAGHAGHWIDIENPGQGVIIEVLADRGQLAMAWFSFARGAPGNGSESGHRWFTALGRLEGNVAELALFRSTGGAFDRPDAVITEPTGTATLEMHSCSSATLGYSFADGTTGMLRLAKITDTGLCVMLSAQQQFPGFARLRAEAEAEFEDGMSVECRLDYIMEVSLADYDILGRMYTGTMGGEAARTVLDADGAGIGLIADAFSPVDVHVTGNRVEITSTLPPPTRTPLDQDSRFWAQLSRFTGIIGDDGAVSGSWLCSPFDTRGDGELFANGNWRLEPITE